MEYIEWECVNNSEFLLERGKCNARYTRCLLLIHYELHANFLCVLRICILIISTTQREYMQSAYVRVSDWSGGGLIEGIVWRST